MRLATPFVSLFLAALALLPAAVVGATASPAPVATYAAQNRPAARMAEVGRTAWVLRFTPSRQPGLAVATTFTFASLVTPFQDPTPTLSVFPNPARGMVSVQLTAQHGPDYKLRLSNVLGREVRLLPLPLSTAATGLPLDVSGLPAGLYFCSLLVNDKAVSTNRLTLL